MVLGLLRGFLSKLFGSGRPVAGSVEKESGFKSQAAQNQGNAPGTFNFGEKEGSVYAANKGKEKERGAYAVTQNIQELFGASKDIEEIHSVWDYLKFQENTQADHLNKVVGFEEWVEMEEIRRRVQELFGVNYKNERSLYPYLKTLSDAGLFESTSAGGRRKWRKRDLLIRAKSKKALMDVDPVCKPYS